LIFNSTVVNDSSGASVLPQQGYCSRSEARSAPLAIDREFKTIDFLALVDLPALPDLVRKRFF